MIKYIGSKRALLPQIVETVRSLPEVRTVLDLFSGTARVGHALKSEGFDVTANDHNLYASTLARCYVQADRKRVRSEVERVLKELESVEPKSGWFTETYCVQSRYLQPHNGARIEGMREAVARMSLEPDVEAGVLTSLMEAADRVDSTCGLQMAYLKQWSARSYNDLELRVPKMLDGPGRALSLDAREAVAGQAWDLVYLDPPYNQHKYLNNYHVWETLVRWDAPEVYGTARKRMDCRSYDSAFNSKPRIAGAMRDLVHAIRARWILVSFNDEGNLNHPDLCSMLGEVGSVSVVEHTYKRYVGARIGIYNPAGEKVGRVGRLTNHEYLYLVRVAA